MPDKVLLFFLFETFHILSSIVQLPYHEIHLSFHMYNQKKLEPFFLMNTSLPYVDRKYSPLEKGKDKSTIPIFAEVHLYIQKIVFKKRSFLPLPYYKPKYFLLLEGPNQMTNKIFLNIFGQPLSLNPHFLFLYAKNIEMLRHQRVSFLYRRISKSFHSKSK